MRVKVITFCIWLVFSVLDIKPILVRAQSLPKVVIGYPASSIASIQLFIAQEKGFFRDEGLDAQLNQVRADAAIAAVLTGELFAYDSVGTSVRAFQKNAPIKILAVNLQSPLFWLVTRPELKSFSELKGKVLGTTSFGGVQHLAGLRMLRRGGLNPEEDITVILAGDPATQLQAVVNGAIQIAVLSPPSVILARDKFKLNILANALDEFPSFFQSGLAVADKSVSSQKDLVKRILRARAKANRFFFEMESGASEVIAKFLKVDLPVARESYRISRNAFTSNGTVSQRQIDEFLKMDAEIAKIPDPLRAIPAFDFSLQHEVNNELGIK
jgi:ABC-type nitrate/sulfonate/bicarbonate transport system substrate-binding protein